MRATRVSAPHQIEIAEVPNPEVQPGQVVVEVRAAALNHRDVWIKAGQYAGVTFPCIPGSDGAGVVTTVGYGVDASWVGREVVINPSLNFGRNPRAQATNFSILGLPRPGTLAEQVMVPVEQLAPKPEHLTWEQCATLPLAGLTAWRAVASRANVVAGERMLITGIGGGVALFALQFGLALGAEVWVTSSSDEKIARAVELGAKGGVNYTKPSWTHDLAAQAGRFDVVVDSAGGPGFDALIDLAASGGRIAVYGATRGNPPALALRKIFWRQLSLLGTTMGSPMDWEGMLRAVSEHRLAPVVSAVFPLARVEEAFAVMERGDQFGKVVVQIK